MSGETHKGDILIVDDTLANLRLLVNVLTEQGYKVRGVPNGALALNATRLEAPDLILLDINMPEMDGFEVCRRLKEDEQTCSIPIIFISALDEVLDKVKAFTMGAVDYITKPIQFEEVLARVETHLSVQRLQKELQLANEDLEKRVEERTEALIKQMDLFRKFVPPTLTQALGNEDFDIRKGYSLEETYSVLSCDIRNFTTFSESITCTECFRFISSFFSNLEPGIRDFGGFVYQYMGDAIMALFKLSDEGHADNVVRSAIAIQNRILSDYNQGRARAGYDPIRIGVGINTGPVAIGVAGTPERMDACALGSTLNLAARCEGLTKELDATIIVTEYTYRLLNEPETFHIQSLGTMPIRGMENEVQLYSVSDSHD